MMLGERSSEGVGRASQSSDDRQRIGRSETDKRHDS